MKINKILMNLGISANLLGFNYIILAFQFLNEQKIHTNMMTVYERVYELSENATSRISIERAIRTAIQKAYRNNSLFRKIYKEIPENSAFLYDLVFNFDIFIEEIEKQDNDYWGKPINNGKYLGPKINETERTIIDISPTNF